MTETGKIMEQIEETEKKKRKSRMPKTGLGIVEVLIIVFLILKFTKVIAWSWGWVLAPVIFDLGICLGSWVTTEQLKDN